MAKGRIVDAVKEGRILVSDGAWGTFLQAKGLEPGDCPELWNVERSQDVFEIAKSYIEAGVDIIGTNCGNGMENMVGIVKEIRILNSEIPVLIHAIAGMPVYKDGKTFFPETPEETAAYIPALLAAGTNIIGGCCGTARAYKKN